MDAFIASHLVMKEKQRVQKMKQSKLLKDSGTDSSVSPIASLLSFIVGAVAVYLSWNCNTIQGHTVLAKVFYAFFAFLFGTLYLIFYVIYHGVLDGPCPVRNAFSKENVERFSFSGGPIIR
jgi:uncharacterized membrane protein YdcZ (DUF606 family)